MSSLMKTLVILPLLCSTAWAVEPTAAQPQSTPPTTAAPAPKTANTITDPSITTKPLTAEQIALAKAEQDTKIKAMVKDQASRLKQLEQANLDALSQNQELQLKNDSLAVQIQVLQSERSAQMFLYGGATIAVGVLLGFLLASYIYSKRRRQW